MRSRGLARRARALAALTLAALTLAALTFTACTTEEGGHAPAADVTPLPPAPWPLVPLPPAPEPADNPGTEAKIALGRDLFYDPVLSSDGTVACATCHSEVWGMGDGMSRSIGVGGVGPTGPGRVGANVTRRNAQTLWNAAYRETFFWDGRAASLEEQVLGPLGQPRELGRDPEALVAQLAGFPGYAAGFAAAFPGPEPAVTVRHMQQAIAAFERSFTSSWAPYDQYVEGDRGSLSDEAARGMFLFGEAGCAGCHVPPRFEAEVFADRGIAPVPGVRDDGREEITHDPADRRAFRVPTLRNIRETGPYFHTGAVETLRDAVAHEAGRAPRALDDGEIDAIVTFLDKGLIDPSHSPVRPDTVPSGLAVPLDGDRIPR